MTTDPRDHEGASGRPHHQVADPGNADADYDVVVVGASPAGCATARRLAHHGHRVVVLERGDRTGDTGLVTEVLTPRALAALTDLGIDPGERRWQRHQGVRWCSGRRTLEVPWPAGEPGIPYSAATQRRTIERALRAATRDAGAEIRYGTEAVEALVERGFVRGVKARTPNGDRIDIRGRYLVVADGAASPFGRALGTRRRPEWPMALLCHGHWESERHEDTWIESAADVTDVDGEHLAAHRWVAPLGDGTVAIGLGMPTTSRGASGRHLSALLERSADALADSWLLGERRGDLVTLQLPVGLSVEPLAGPTFVVVGDAAGTANPFNADRLSFGLDSAATAAQVLHQALTHNDPTMLQAYPRALNDHIGSLFSLGRLFLRAASRPRVAHAVLATGVRTPTLARRALRLATGLTQTGEPLAAAERALLAAARNVTEA